MPRSLLLAFRHPAPGRDLTHPVTLLGSLLMLLCACAPGKVGDTPADVAGSDGGAADSAGGVDGPSADGGEGSDGGSDGGSEPEDRDGDGYFTPEDCDDRDPAVYPGAPETWNAWDDDCDGYVDADGEYAGTIRLTGAAVAEGASHALRTDCSVSASRGEGQVVLQAECPNESGDELRFLGAMLTLTLGPLAISGPSYAGDLEARSSDGWDTFAAVNLDFSRSRALDWSTNLSAPNLNLSGTGDLLRSEVPPGAGGGPAPAPRGL
jgi:hypothetical protein